MKFLRRVGIKHLGVSLAAVAFLLSTMSYGAPMGKVKFVDVDGVKTGYFEGGSGEARSSKIGLQQLAETVEPKLPPWTNTIASPLPPSK